MSPNRYVQSPGLMRKACILVVVIVNISSIIPTSLPFFFFFFVAVQDDFLVSKPVKQHLAKYDKELKKFNVSRALDTAMTVRHRKTALLTRDSAVFLGMTFNSNDMPHFICRQGPGRESQRSQWLS